MEKNKALDAALAQIERAFGKGSIMRMGAKGTDEQIEVIPSGSLGLDLALGIGGLPRGRIIEIYGPESSGKTTLALHAIAEAQKRGGTCAFIDAEHALDPGYAKKLGVDIDNMLISQPDAGEQALEICDTLVRSGAIDVLVVDSVAALAQIERAFGKGSIMRMGAKGTDEQIEVIPSGSTSRWASAACRADASSKSTGRKVRARPRWPCTSSPRPRRRAAPARSSTPNTRWTPSTPASWA